MAIGSRRPASAPRLRLSVEEATWLSGFARSMLGVELSGDYARGARRRLREAHGRNAGSAE